LNKFSLTGKKALVTGGNRGIGLGIAQEFAQAGADLVLLARDQAALEEARGQVESTGRRVAVYSFDLNNVEEIPGMYAQIIQDSGAIDILVNNAGTICRGPAEEISLEDWNLVMTVNLTAVFVLSQAFAREHISSKRPGKIINIASLMSEAVRPGVSPYAVSKAGIKQVTKALAVEWAEYGINVNAIGPGYIRTDLNQPLQDDPEFSAWVEQRTPQGKWGMPGDIGSAAVFLASGASDFVTGQVIYVDGGWLATF